MAQNRLKSLDFLRGVAVVLVLGRHLHEFPQKENIFIQICRAWKTAGWIGVDLFFVLSGFLVSGLLFTEFKKNQSIDYKRFYIRRGFKIYPAFYILMIVSVLLSMGAPPIKNILCEVFFVQNYFMGVYNFWNHTWSLAVEEHFYFLLGLTLFLGTFFRKSKNFNFIPMLCIVLSITCLFLRYINYPFDTTHTRILFQTHYRIDSLFFGVFLSYCYYFHSSALLSWWTKYKVFLRILSFSLIIPFFYLSIGSSKWMVIVGPTVLYLAFGMILLHFLYNKDDSLFKNSFIAKQFCTIGFYSYSIYLWHEPWKHITAVTCQRDLKLNFGFYELSFLYVLFALLGGILIAKIVEMPFLKLRDKYFPSRSN